MRFPAWVRLLGRHRPDPDRLGRVLDISLTSLACWPMDLVEEVWTRRARALARVEAPVFVLGHWRSGTTWLQQLLATDPGLGFVSGFHCGAAGRFLVFGSLWRRLLAALAPRDRPMDAVAIGPDEPAEEESGMARVSDQAFDHCFHFPRDAAEIVRRGVLLDGGPEVAAGWMEAYRDFLARVSLDLPGRRLVLKSPANTARIRFLRELYPDARFIHIARDPYEVFVSTRRMWRDLIDQQGFQHVSPAAVETAVLDTYRDVMARYLADRAGLDPGTLREVRYEELLARPGAMVAELLEWAGSARTEAATRALAEYLGRSAAYVPGRQEPEPRERAVVSRAWGPLIEALGYRLR